MASTQLGGAQIAADGLVGQVEYIQHEKDAGNKIDSLPEPFSHVNDETVKVDTQVEDWHFPTEEEQRTLRRVPERIPIAAFAVGFCEFAERFSYYGVTQVFTSFITYKRPEFNRAGASGDRPNVHSGALGKGQQAANGLTTFNTFWVYCTPLLGAYIADEYIGRFNTIVLAVFIALIGHVLLIIAAIPSVLDDINGAYACFIIAIVVMGLGTGMFKSNCSVLIVDQMRIKTQTVAVLKTGERVIIDPSLTIARIYMWFYMLINLGSLAGQLGMIYAVRRIGYWFAYMLPTIVFALCIPVLLFGRNYYIRYPPQGSVISRAGKVWKYALKQQWSWNPTTWKKLCTSPTFWEVAKPSNVPASERPAWMTYQDVWVDELSRGIKACSIFFLLPIYFLCYNQISGTLLQQAGQLNFGTSPQELVSQLDPIFIIVFIPVFTFLLYPYLERRRIPFTPIKRITVGFFVASIAMIWSAVVQHYIYESTGCGKYVGSANHIDADTGRDCESVTSNINVWVQSGSYVFVAFSELFASVTSLEVAVLMAPKNMKSIVMAISVFTSAIAAAIQEAFNPLAKNPNFVINYGVFAGMAFAGGILFYALFRGIDKRQEELNLIGNTPDDFDDDSKPQFKVIDGESKAAEERPTEKPKAGEPQA
ncbi:hypothetical protein MCUN1_002041 [Malassezia cuniculi]|uniref:Uncharacterized protein n=1 Tax=Malassezia cuniculi TaxID=948313 RepID=A0AAF0JBD6_9BASI|nr:hypothetical protein MCUN1_002041 [Malassezia cuniculi]